MREHAQRKWEDRPADFHKGRAGHAACQVEVDPHRRRDDAGNDGGDEDDAEMDGVDAILRDDGHEQRREDKDDGPALHEAPKHEKECHEHTEDDPAVRGDAGEQVKHELVGPEEEHHLADGIGTGDDDHLSTLK